MSNSSGKRIMTIIRQCSLGVLTARMTPTEQAGQMSWYVSASRGTQNHNGKLDSIWFGSYWCSAGKASGLPAHAPEQGGAHDAQGLIMKSVTNSASNDAGDCLTQVELVRQTH